MTILICCDRDGTINKDENYYLGKDPNWRDQVEFIPGVIKGLSILRSHPDVFIHFVTNQAGVAIANPEFKEFDEDRMHEVNEHIIDLLAIEHDIGVDGYVACPFVDNAYVEKYWGRFEINPDYIVEGHPDLKPRTGMIDQILERIKAFNIAVYMIGDRKSDVLMGLNARGTSVLVPSFKTRELGDVARVEELMQEYPSRIYIASDFLNASRWIMADIMQRHL